MAGGRANVRTARASQFGCRPASRLPDPWAREARRARARPPALCASPWGRWSGQRGLPTSLPCRQLMPPASCVFSRRRNGGWFAKPPRNWGAGSDLYRPLLRRAAGALGGEWPAARVRSWTRPLTSSRTPLQAVCIFSTRASTAVSLAISALSWYAGNGAAKPPGIIPTRRSRIWKRGWRFSHRKLRTWCKQDPNIRSKDRDSKLKIQNKRSNTKPNLTTR